MEKLTFKEKLLNLPLIKNFNSWKLTYKLMFIFGFVMALVNLSSLIVYFWWSIEKNYLSLKNSGIQNHFKDWTKANPTYRPDALALIWSNTLTFTMISNWLLTINLLLLPFFQNSQRAKSMFFTANVIITITFLIYWSLIFPTYFKGKSELLDHWYLLMYSTILHAINPLVGFIFMWFIRKEIQLKKCQLWMTNIFVLAYFTFALVTFFIGSKFINLETKNNQNPYGAYHITIYGFLNFKQPLFYKGGNTAVIILLDILMFLVAFFVIPGIAYLWKLAYRIQIIKPNKINKLEEKIIE